MTSFGILGLGEWGTALATHLTKKGFCVTAWSRNQETRDAVSKKYKELHVVSEIEALKNSKNIVVALPGKGLPDASKIIKQILTPETCVISATKGLNPTDHKTPLSMFANDLKIKPPNLCVISGPSFSSDLLDSRPLSLTAASESESTAKEIAVLFSNSTTRVYASTDTLGVELGGIMKNVIAIAAGVSDGLHFGASARAAVITRGLAEMVRLATKLGAKQETLFGLSGLGDLVMTCSEDKSRNRRVGLGLGRGQKLPEILKEIGSVAEGVHTASLLKALAQEHGIELPITIQVTRLLEGNIEPRQVARELLERPLKTE